MSRPTARAVNDTAATAGVSISGRAVSAPPSTTWNTSRGRIGEDLVQQQRGGRRGAGRLQDRGVAVGQAGCGLPQRDRDREVPRREQRDDADRAYRAISSASWVAPGGSRRRAAARAGRSTQDRHAPGHLAAGLGDRLAHLADGEADHLVRAAFQRGGRVRQRLRPGRGRGPAPVAGRRRRRARPRPPRSAPAGSHLPISSDGSCGFTLMNVMGPLPSLREWARAVFVGWRRAPVIFLDPQQHLAAGAPAPRSVAKPVPIPPGRTCA